MIFRRARPEPAPPPSAPPAHFGLVLPCTTPGCDHITPGADDPAQPMPATFWRSPECLIAWQRDHQWETT